MLRAAKKKTALLLCHGKTWEGQQIVGNVLKNRAGTAA
jgi:hypothetical protein